MLRGMAPLDDVFLIVPIIVAIVVSTLSWAYIEQPVRQRRFLKSTKGVYVFFGLVIVGVAIFSLTMSLRYKAINTGNEFAKDDFTDVASNMGAVQRYTLSDADGAPRILLIGDSHAQMYQHVVLQLAKEYAVNVDVAVQPGCSFMSLEEPRFQQNAECNHQVEKEVRDLFAAKEGKYDAVLWSERLDIVYRQNHLDVALFAWLDKLSQLGHQVWAVKQVPCLPVSYGLRKVLPQWRYELLHQALHVEEHPEVAAMPRTDFSFSYLASSEKVQPLFARAAMKNPSISVLDPVGFLCGDGLVCRISFNGQALYHDDDHLSRAGALFLRPMFEPIFEKISKKTPKYS